MTMANSFQDEPLFDPESRLGRFIARATDNRPYRFVAKATDMCVSAVIVPTALVFLSTVAALWLVWAFYRYPKQTGGA